MLRIVLAYKTPSLNEDPEVLYCGCDGDKAEKAVQSSTVRVEVALAPTLIRRRGLPATVEAVNKQKGK